MSTKVYVVGGGTIKSHFIGDNVAFTESMDEADVAVFTGGADIDPAIYGAKRHQSTYTSANRCKYEVQEYEALVEKDNIKLIIGICRGAQLACALNGGLLIQDINNHYGKHPIIIAETQEGVHMTSIHHQMMYPFEMPEGTYEILAYTPKHTSKFYLGDKIDPEKIKVEPEIILFNGKKRALAIQGHPEMMSDKEPAIHYIKKIIQDELRNEKPVH